MTNEQLAILLEKYVDKMNLLAQLIDGELDKVTTSDITSPGTSKKIILNEVEEITSGLQRDIDILTIPRKK